MQPLQLIVVEFAICEPGLSQNKIHITVFFLMNTHAPIICTPYDLVLTVLNMQFFLSLVSYHFFLH